MLFKMPCKSDKDRYERNDEQRGEERKAREGDLMGGKLPVNEKKACPGKGDEGDGKAEPYPSGKPENEGQRQVKNGGKHPGFAGQGNHLKRNRHCREKYDNGSN